LVSAALVSGARGDGRCGFSLLKLIRYIWEELLIVLATTSSEVVLLAQATNTPITIEQQIGLLLVLLLAWKGVAGVAGAAFVVLAATLASVGSVPVESVALTLGVHRLMSEGLTPTNLIGNAVATIVVAKWEKAVDERRLQQALDGNVEDNLAQI